MATQLIGESSDPAVRERELQELHARLAAVEDAVCRGEWRMAVMLLRELRGRLAPAPARCLPIGG